MEGKNKFKILKRIILVMVASLVAFFVWANFTHIEQSARSGGQIIAVAKTQLIQGAVDGVIEKILVREGQKVHQGELLVQLEDSQASAAVIDSKSKIAATRVTLTRLRAEVYEHDLRFPSDLLSYKPYIENQTALFMRRKRALNEEISALNQILNAAKRELAISEPLLAKGDIAETEIIRLKRSVAEIEGSITNRRNKYFQDAQAEMTKFEEDLQTLQQVLVDRTTNLERTKLNAPVDGIVRNIRLTTLGGRVRSGEVVMELLPTDSELIVETKLKPSDLAFVHVGQKALVKLDAFDYSIFGGLSGEVTYISPDALNEESMRPDLPGHIYYRVHVKVDPSNQVKTHGGKQIEVQPGMTVQTDIKTSSSTVFQYLMKPIVRTYSSAFTER
ncbi:MAG: HlyD family efflux transporter periplasmic adaptor subunit [Gammaproteobacteria bacterium]|nr:HlyD family efflux transporter periplasmic adaptor subunit [Gammaproteobacteria bacterium]